MDPIRLFDSLSREVRELPPGRTGRFRFYVCGPTVYGPAHIGNFLTFVRFDVLYRLLRLAGYEPFYVRNITDVDDKTIQGALAGGQALETFTEGWTRRFHQDCSRLNLLPPDIEPRATAHIAEQIDMVRQLLERGNAYVGPDGSVYYRVTSFADYGKLSHFDPAALQRQATNSGGSVNLADEYERDSVADFALWKAAKETDGPVRWDSPWGPGRPGWHLECSAMSLKYLGSAFDLHGGGEDLCFPHHENEIAQSEAATGEPFARHWMHSVHLLVEGRKMSKSLGNFFTLSDLIERGHDPVEIRMAMLGGHYRQQFNFTFDGLEAARSGLTKLESGARSLLEAAGMDTDGWARMAADPRKPDDWGPFQNSWNAFRNDLNTPAVLGGLFSGLKRARKLDGEAPAREALRAFAALLFGLGIPLFTRRQTEPGVAVPEAIRKLADARWEARQARAFDRADDLRSRLADDGWVVVDRPDGYELKPRNP
jgi:cysteinyl-tRNA synthetase